MSDTEDCIDPATPDLFNSSYAGSDGRATPEDNSSVEGVTMNAVASRRKRRGRPPIYLTGEVLDSWADPHSNVHFRVGDFIYFDGKKTGDPFRVGTILSIRQSKRDRVCANVKLYFRATELPEGVYQRLMADRNSDTLAGFGDFLEENERIRVRELFKSEKCEVIRSQSVRGKCTVIQLTDVQSVKRFVPVADTFFTLLGYNPDTRRLATIQGEIRIGQSHQAKLPECNPSVALDDRACRPPPEDGQGPADEQLWTPGRIEKDELEAYITAARSMVASFANMADRRSADESALSARRDENTQTALNQLHRSDYNKNEAVAEFAKSVPVIRSVDRRWDEDDSKKFMKGLRVFGKNFFRIRKEFLPEKETKELIEYYYYWKKTPISTVGNRNPRRPKSNRKPGTNANKTSSSAGEASSESEEGESSESYICFRCDTETSNQWHYVDEHGFVCESCKLNYRKYGDEHGERIPEYLFRPVEPMSNYRRPPPMDRKSKDGDDVEAEDASGRKSPSASSTSSNGSTSKGHRKRKSPSKLKRQEPSNNETSGNREDLADSDNETLRENKKKKMDESPDSLASDLRSHHDEGEDNGHMGDVEQDDASSNTPPSPTNSEDSLAGLKIGPDESIAKECHEVVLEKKESHFIRHLKRGENSCCRSDVFYLPAPNSTWANKRAERARKPPVQMPPTVPVAQPEVKVKSEPTNQVTDTIRHTPLSSHHTNQLPPIAKASVPPTSMSMPSPHHMQREARATPTHAPSVSSVHHGGLPHLNHNSHRVSTPSQQRVTPRSQSNDHMFMAPGTPALSQLSQLAGAGRHQQLEEMSKLMNANPAAAAAAAAASGGPFGMPPGGIDMLQQLQQLQQYRFMRSVLPTEALDRMMSPEVREKFDMALKQQELQEKMMMPHGTAALENKNIIEAQMLDMQRKLGLHPGMMMPPGLSGLSSGFAPPTSVATSAANPMEVLAREQERMQKLGLGMFGDSLTNLTASPAGRLSADRQMPTGDRGLVSGIPTAHAHTHTHTHLHLHQQFAEAMAMAHQNPYLAQQLFQNMNAQGDPNAQARSAIAAAAASGLPFGSTPPGLPAGMSAGLMPPTSTAGDINPNILAAMMPRVPAEMDPRELLNLQQVFMANPALAQQQEAFQRSLLERSRLPH